MKSYAFRTQCCRWPLEALHMAGAVHDARSALEERPTPRCITEKTKKNVHRQAHKELRSTATVHTDARWTKRHRNETCSNLLSSSGRRFLLYNDHTFVCPVCVSEMEFHSEAFLMETQAGRLLLWVFDRFTLESHGNFAKIGIIDWENKLKKGIYIGLNVLHNSIFYQFISK